MKEIKRYLDNRDGIYSFYFEDLKSGYTYGLNENVQMTAAGCIKVPIAMALMKEIENNNFNIDDKVSITKNDMVSGKYSIIHEFSEKEYTIKELLIAMLIQSDNTAACKIVNLVGMDRINELIKDMKLYSTEVRKYPSENKIDDNKENVTTSHDLSKCLRLLSNNSYLNEEHSSLILETLKKNQVNTGIPFYLPHELQSTTANKIGTLKCVENDTALLNLPKGNFVFTVMSSNLPSNVYGLTTISRIGKMMFDMVDKDWN
ncbi:D-alanyl-D-alanine carboxypeptidase family protein [Clostridium argentinense CDC 2741]|uniref:D-alanyl-D-alanine carboxypeptidase family protein n=1 Tax=Clostridium argentinense CDC 2741 TaxID=1418104 RepID=A0A0C1U717_9CLOT|nr:serine hydrolase [Clostridium argentinense]ARC84757.1 serine hydrolase [Clostridium argentinense]KIE47618.1 D-alanyl-D-alanine carboxypeptidase family protein [Clostridium argentinense CDC 2741]NFF41575.1 serine hydrolase [Clostridium argentinense]NFP51842.1 serine hydrolase [Clostridium argentinense]NFP74441.1 serine hydrolase [Clostridium argentinense]